MMLLTPWRRASLMAPLCALALTACNNQGTEAPPEQEMTGAGVGEACVLDSNCRDRLVCGPERTCQPGGGQSVGQLCTLTGECSEGSYCDQTSLCAPAGEVDLGGGCGSTADCTAGLVCTPAGLTGQCTQPGEGDVGDPCQSSQECLAGLGCGVPVGDPAAPMQCLTGPSGGALLPYVGVNCEFSSDVADGAPRLYFEIPDGEVTEFYRLPFPNDIRRKDGRLDLSGHPTPGTLGLGFDIVQTYIDAIERDQDGFGLNQAVFFRFSDRLDFDSLEASGDNPSHYLVNIDPDSAEYGQRHPIFWQANTGIGRYICANWLSVRPSWGRPLLPGTTYAVVFTDRARNRDGLKLEPDEDFAAVMAESRPSDAAQGAGWDTYQPLRDFLAEQGIAQDSVVGASVFTTGDPYRDIRQLREVIFEDPEPPAASSLTLCQEGVSSPCDDGLEGEDHVRGCFGAQEAFHEVQGRLSLPIFQVGQAPYLESGGGLSNDSGAPVLQGRQQVCMAMAVPRAQMPEAGWPVVIYAHGTGGTYRNHIGSLAQQLTQLQTDGQDTHFVVLGWDQVLHGERKEGSDLEPDSLVFNFLNPDAARGNFLQAAAEVHALIRYVQSVNLAADASPTGEALRLDPERIYFVGHSQGGTSGPIALPFAPEIKGAVLSGSGGALTWSLLSKTSPVNIPVGVQVALRDPGINDNHPVLSLLQGYFESVDPLNYGPYLAARSLEGQTSPRHILHVMGVGDTYTPPRTQEILSTAMRAPLLGPLRAPFEGRDVTPEEGPIQGNLSRDGVPYTLLGRQYEPAPGDDGHFVLFRDEEARDDLGQFLGSALTQDAPSVD